VSEDDQTSIQRLQAVMTALLERQLVGSLEKVDGALGRWRKGELGVFEAHAELLKHAAHAERMADRMARIGLDNAGALLRDAFDAGLIDRDEFEGFVGKPPEDVRPSPSLAESARGMGLPAKREFVEDLLTRGPVVLHVDARRREAQVPDRFREDAKLVLRFGYGLTPAIIDLSIDNDGIGGTLTFGGIPHRCVLPWDTVYAVVGESCQKGMVWPDDVPDCVVDSLLQPVQEQPGGAADPADPAVVAPAAEEASKEASKRGSHLKLVK
jgi:stringent starvation protein B